MSNEQPQKAGSLWTRLFGMERDPFAEEAKPDETAYDEILPEPPLLKPPLPDPFTEPGPLPSPESPVVLPTDPTRVIEPIPLAEPAVVAPAPVVELTCPSCGEKRKKGLIFCDECGFLFPPPGSEAAKPTPAVPIAMPVAAIPEPPSGMPMPPTPPFSSPSLRIRDRYLLGQLVSERAGISRYRGLDAGSEPTLPIVIVRAEPATETVFVESAVVPLAGADELLEEEFIPTFDTESAPTQIVEPLPMAQVEIFGDWPRPAWERDLLTRIGHPAFPAVLDSFTEGGYEYLILEEPQGQLLWDAWDDPDADADRRYEWLQQLAGALAALHSAGAMLEAISPEMVVIDESSQIRIANLVDLLPLPLPPAPPLRANLYTPPDLILAPDTVTARSVLYSFGAIIYSLEYLHHGLEEKDFESPYVPKQITDRFPDVHPLLPRLINKTFVRDVNSRFPSDDGARTDPTGFTELIEALGVCRKSFDRVRLDIAAWTTTGMVRSGNEDAMAFLHGVDSREDELYEYALCLLCDGMGGYDAGEIAAALAISAMRKYLLEQPMFAGLAGREPPKEPLDVDAARKLFEGALKHANKEVFGASRIPGKGKRGMGCTAEAVYIDHRHIIVGHVGDSRVYHLREGRLVQMTRDQTLVNRLVELGQITAEEAEDHPRKNELQQAIGGQPDVSVGIYDAKIKRGDWVLVCSDGLSNHIGAQELEKMLTRETANSAEEAARRLLNLVNLRGATDNATVVIVRAS
jgi:PPM family protein phosphatase